MKKAYALKISEKNVDGLRHYGYTVRIPSEHVLMSYLIFGTGGPFVVNQVYFEETFKFTDENTTIELTKLLDFGADQDERTLKPFVPKKSRIDYWDSFAIQLFYDKKPDFSGSFKAGISVAIPD